MTFRVPDTKIRQLLKAGKYRATITAFEEPKFMQIREGLRIRVTLRVHDVPEEMQTGFAFLAGYLPAMLMIYRARRHWLNKEVDVKVGIREHRGHYSNNFHIDWPLEGNDKDDNTGYPK